MPPACAAVATESAGHMPFPGHPVTELEPAHLAAHLHDLAAILMADGHGYLDSALRPVVPMEDVHVGTADGGFLHADQYIVRPDRRPGDISHPDARLGLGLDQCF